MDPLSITTGCLSLLGAIANTTIAISGFVKGCREARRDLTDVSRELSDLKIVLELLKDDSEAVGEAAIPEAMHSQIKSLLTGCHGVILTVDKVIQRHEGRLAAVKWVADGKKEVAYLRQSLEAYRGTLSLTLETVNLSVTKAIKVDTTALKSDTADIKEDTSQILAEIARLRSLLSEEQQDNVIMERYLDSITSYAETVYDEAVRDGSINEGISSTASSPKMRMSPDQSWVSYQEEHTIDDDAPRKTSRGDLKISAPRIGGVRNELTIPHGEAGGSGEDLEGSSLRRDSSTEIQEVLAPHTPPSTSDHGDDYNLQNVPLSPKYMPHQLGHREPGFFPKISRWSDTQGRSKRPSVVAPTAASTLDESKFYAQDVSQPMYSPDQLQRHGVGPLPKVSRWSNDTVSRVAHSLKAASVAQQREDVSPIPGIDSPRAKPKIKIDTSLIGTAQPADVTGPGPSPPKGDGRDALITKAYEVIATSPNPGNDSPNVGPGIDELKISVTDTDQPKAVEPSGRQDTARFLFSRSFDSSTRYSHVAVSVDCSILAACWGPTVSIWHVWEEKLLKEFSIRNRDFDSLSSYKIIRKLAILSTVNHIIALQINNNSLELWDWMNPIQPILKQRCRDGAWACYDPRGLIGFLDDKGVHSYSCLRAEVDGTVRGYLRFGKMLPVEKERRNYSCEVVSYSESAHFLVAAFERGRLLALGLTIYTSKKHSWQSDARYPLAIASNEQTIVSAWSSEQPVQSGKGYMDTIVLWTVNSSTLRTVKVDAKSPTFSRDGHFFGSFIRSTYNGNPVSKIQVFDSDSGKVTWQQSGRMASAEVHDMAFGQISGTDILVATGKRPLRRGTGIDAFLVRYRMKA